MNEVFDSKLPVEWEHQGRFELASFVVGSIRYVIQVERKPLVKVSELKDKKTGEVSFFADGPENTHSTLSQLGTSASKVYGVVFNALVNKFNEYDAFYFVANTRDSNDIEEVATKSRIYLALADRLTKTTNAKVYDQKTNYGNAFLVSKVDISSVDFVNETIEYLKTVDWNTVPSLPIRN